MKSIFKKNQLIITAMAALIAVAGYLNYTEKNIQDKQVDALAKEKATVVADENASGESGENTGKTEAESKKSDESVNTSGEVNTDEPTKDASSGDITSVDTDLESTPGEAIFVNAKGTVDFVVEAKMAKEYSRVTIEESLQGIISNAELSENERKEAVDRMVELTKVAEREVAAENLIMAKGYSDVVVTQVDDSVDVIIVAEELDNVTRAQIEDIVKRKMEVNADKITINVVDVAKTN